MAKRGASQVIGIDIRESVLAEARARANEQGVANLCTFTSETKAKADVIVSVDAFEHNRGRFGGGSGRPAELRGCGNPGPCCQGVASG